MPTAVKAVDVCLECKNCVAVNRCHWLPVTGPPCRGRRPRFICGSFLGALSPERRISNQSKMPMTQTSAEIIELFDDFVIGNYTRFPVCLVRGEESHVWDAEGRRYLRCVRGWGCCLLGHCPRRVVEAVKEQVAQLIHVPNTWYTAPQGLLGKTLSERTGFG